MKNMIIATLVVALLTLSSTLLNAQTQTFPDGRIYDPATGDWQVPQTDADGNPIPGKYIFIKGTQPQPATGASGPSAVIPTPGTSSGQGFFARQWGKVTGWWNSSTPSTNPSQWKGFSYWKDYAVYGKQVADKNAQKLAKKGTSSSSSGGGWFSWITGPLATATGALAMLVFLAILVVGQWICPKSLEIFIVPPALAVASIILGLATGYWGRIIGGGIFAILASLCLCQIGGKPLIMRNKAGAGGDLVRYLLAIGLAIIMCLVSC